MQPASALGLFLLLVFSGGALLAPGLYGLVQWLAGQQTVWAGWGEIPFHRVLNRAVLGLTLIGLWPLLRRLQVSSWRELGLEWDRTAWSRLGAGFGLGFIILACVAFSSLAVGARVLKAHYTILDMARHTLAAGLSGVAVGLLEETLFRGALFGALRKAHHWVVALGVSSVVYALVHFLAKPAAPEDVVWHSGFLTLWGMLRGFMELDKLLPGFLVLTVAGAILGVCYHRTGTLYFPIGVHAGLVFWMKLYGAVTSSRGGSSVWFWGTRKLYDGWLAFLVLTLVLAGCMVLPSRTKCHEQTGR